MSYQSKQDSPDQYSYAMDQRCGGYGPGYVEMMSEVSTRWGFRKTRSGVAVCWEKWKGPR